MAELTTTLTSVITDYLVNQLNQDESVAKVHAEKIVLICKEYISDIIDLAEYVND